MTVSDAPANRLLKAAQAAQILGLSVSCLARWRLIDFGPTYVRLGPTVIRYPEADLRAWLARYQVQPAAADVGKPAAGAA